MKLERKTVHLEVKEIDEEEGTFTAYGATFSEHPDSYGDIIDPGAFKKTIKEGKRRIKILWNHDTFEPIGKPIELSEDETGLLIKGKLSLGVQRAREVLSLMKDGIINEMSIGYNPIKEKMIDGVRHLQEIKLYDVSPVSFAANTEAVVLGVKTEGKPFPNEHACRLRDPGDFDEDSFRRMTRTSDGKKYFVIMGKLEGEDTMTEQAYRYDKEVWEKDDAETHCGEHDGSFEAATGSSALDAGKLGALIDNLQALLEGTKSESEPEPTPLDDVAEEAARLESVVAGLKISNDDIDVREAEKRIDAILGQIREKE